VARALARLTWLRRWSRGGAVALFVVLGAGALFSAPLRAQAAWLDSGDGRLRSDLALLVDRGAIRLPLTAWPMPLADLDAAASAVRQDRLDSAAALQAWQRIRTRLATGEDSPGMARGWSIAAGKPGELRDFDSRPREETEISLRLVRHATRWSGALHATFAASPSDDQVLRLDGSHLTGRVGNWLISASLQQRHWGPAHESSLILSTNARPIPALVVDRAVTAPADSPWLRWIGSWRATAMLGVLESDRADIDRPLFFGLRATWQPVHWLEIGLSRSAQFCGAGRPCDLRTFGDMLLGRDNVGGPGQGNTSLDRQPGNQLAGFDIRLASPWRTLPLAIYTQDIGEDQIGGKPTDRLHLFGVEAVLGLASGASLRGYVEYSDTSCAANDEPPEFDCAYTNNLFNADGYRYRGAVIGHTSDADSEMRAAGLRLIESSGREWRARLRNADINRGGRPDPWHSRSALPITYESADLSVRDRWFGSDIEIQFGVEQRQAAISGRHRRAFGQLVWRR
jgi:hypothetical protein